MQSARYILEIFYLFIFKLLLFYSGFYNNTRAIGADITYAWPDAKIGTMDAKLAAKIICDGQDAAAIDACAAEYEALQTSAESAAQRGYVDQIIEAADTRKYVIGAFEMLFTKREDGPVRKHGTV